jgi:predicted MFS family arabinose efflux permease
MQSWGALRGLPRAVWIAAAATLVNRVGTMALPFLALYLTRALGEPPAFAANLIAVYGACALVASFAGGALADRWGPRRASVVTLGLAGVALCAFPLAQSRASLLCVTVALALPNEAFRPAGLALVGTLAPPSKRRVAFALHRLAGNLGMSFGPALGGLLAGVWFPGLFIADGVTSLAAAGILLALAPAERAAADGRVGDERAASAADGARGRGPWADPAYLFFAVGTLGIAAVFFQFDSSIPLYLVRDLGLSEREFGLSFTINTVLILIFEVPLTAAIARWPAPRAMALGALLIGVGVAATGLARGFWTFGLTVVVWTVGEMLVFPGTAAYASDKAPPGRVGAYMGVLTMAFGLAHTVGPWGGIHLLERLGPSAVWAASLGCGLASAVVLGLVRPPEPARIEPDALADALVEPIPSSRRW